MFQKRIQKTEVAEAPQVTLAQSAAADIRAQLAELEAKRAVTADNIQRMNDVLHGDWKAAAKDSVFLDQASVDLEREHRLLRRQDQLIAAARDDLAKAERQITIDRFNGVAARFDALMTSKTEKAFNIIATCKQLAAMVKELSLIDQTAMRLFSHDAEETGLNFTEASQIIGKVDVQGEVEMLIESLLVPERLWHAEKPVWGYPSNLDTRLANNIDSERETVLANMAQVVARVGAGERLTPDREDDAAMASMAAAQARGVQEAL